jgi:hypothetical protein
MEGAVSSWRRRGTEGWALSGRISTPAVAVQEVFEDEGYRVMYT